MRIRIIVFLFLGLVTTSCGKRDTPAPTSQSAPPPGPASPQAEWKKFTSKEDGFIVSFPTTPETASQDNQYDFGKVTIRAYTSNPTRNVVWRVATHNYPEPFASRVKPERLLTLMRDGMAANVKGKVEGVKEVTLDGHPGQEFLVQAPDPFTNKPLTNRIRLFAVGSRVYQVGVTAPAEDTALGPEASKFFASFRLMK
jgi:hypothetical protein